MNNNFRIETSDYNLKIRINGEPLGDMIALFIKHLPINVCGRRNVCIYDVIIEEINDGITSHGYLITHYGAVIAIYCKAYNLFILNKWYYDISQSTSNVRNRFSEWITGTDIPNTKQLRKAEKYGLVLTVRIYDYIIQDLGRRS